MPRSVGGRTPRRRGARPRPTWLDGRVLVDAPRSATSTPDWKTVTANATVNTKGDYAEIIAATSGVVTMVRVRAYNTFVSAEDSSILCDIAYGTAGNEVVFLANLPVGWLGTTMGTGIREFWFPTPSILPAGTRLAARCQAATKVGGTVDRAVSVAIDTFKGTTPGTVDTIGTTLASSQGTAVAAGLSNVEGTWTQITASTAAAYRALYLGIGCAGDTTVQTGDQLIDVGVGASSSEVAVITDFYFDTANTEVIRGPSQPPIPVNIPAGSRLAARIQSSQAGAQSFDVTLFGIR